MPAEVSESQTFQALLPTVDYCQHLRDLEASTEFSDLPVYSCMTEWSLQQPLGLRDHLETWVTGSFAHVDYSRGMHVHFNQRPLTAQKEAGF